MVVLRNIMRDEIRKIIEADYYPDNGEAFGHIVVDMITEELVSYPMVDGRAWRASALGHAFQGLLELINAETFPEKKTICWY